MGFGDTTGLEELLVQPDKVVQLGRPPNRIDILSGISGVDFDQAVSTSVLAEIDGIKTPFIGFDALIQNKTAAGRPKDQADVSELRKIRGRQA